MNRNDDSHSELRKSIQDLQSSYLNYMKALKAVLDKGDANIDELVEALNHKHANPIAKALGLMVHSPKAKAALPRLLDWLVVQSPMYPDVLEALVRSGSTVVPLLIERLTIAASKGDDEAVRNLLDLGSRLREDSVSRIVECAINLLHHDNAEIREAAADAIWRIGLPAGKPAGDILAGLAKSDPSESVRKACEEALVRLGCA